MGKVNEALLPHSSLDEVPVAAGRCEESRPMTDFFIAETRSVIEPHQLIVVLRLVPGCGILCCQAWYRVP